MALPDVEVTAPLLSLLILIPSDTFALPTGQSNPYTARRELHRADVERRGHPTASRMTSSSASSVNLSSLSE